MSSPAPRLSSRTDSSAASTPPAALDDGRAWRAVETRDARFDDRFVYAVRSTGIYCRPSCPSRRPRRDNVQFFASSAAAERGGFRACLRCRPRSGDTTAATDAVAAAVAHLEQHVDERVTLDALADVAGMSASHLQRVFTRTMGVSPRAYHDALRVARLKQRLRAGDTVSRATFDAGYGSSSRVYERSDSALGMTPAAYRRGGAGLSIHYTCAPSPYGTLLAGRTARGVCAVLLADDADAAVDALRADFPRATLVPAADDDALLARVSAAVAGRDGADALPLDLQGTAFQQEVWRVLRAIPAGETRSYAEIAALLGRPSAVRAVARACASNRVAILVPCHRVVRTDGALAGYRWGVARKERLLDAERHGRG